MLRRFLIIMTLWFISGLAQGVVLRDDRQVDVHIKKPPQRIVSLLPSLTETVCALGQCHKLVGVDRYSNWPESVAKLPRLGGGLDASIERVVAAKPDLVLMASSARGAERLDGGTSRTGVSASAANAFALRRHRAERGHLQAPAQGVFRRVG